MNPDQRIQADTKTLTELTTDLGIGLVQSTVMLLSFVGVLWILSQGVVLPVAGRDLVIPGYMVWAALFYAATGSLVSWRVGRPLVRLGADRYAHEADFRAGLAQGAERAEGIALDNAEVQTRAGLETALGTLVGVLRGIARARMRLTWITAGSGWIGLVFPIVVAAPGYFAGRLSFGELMMVVGAFNQPTQPSIWSG